MRALSFDDISLVPRYNNIRSRRDVDTSVQFGRLKLDMPVFSSNMDTVTGVEMAREIYNLGGLGFLHRFCSIEKNVEMYNDICFSASQEGMNTPFGKAPDFKSRVAEVVVSLGVNEGHERFSKLYNAGARYFCIDVAHGHCAAVGDIITTIKKIDKTIHVTAGNVCHAAGAEFLAEKGADAIKVGIGPGGVCSTRVKTGFGVPQFSAIQECRRANVFIIADGGIKVPGDAVKALAAGADAIMVGGMLAGCDETPGDIITDVVKNSTNDWVASKDSYKLFRGMASKEAQDDFMGSMQGWKAAEGIEIRVNAKGPVSDVIADLMGGIRSGLTYCGANNLGQIRDRAEWVEVSAAGAAEGRPHAQGRL